MASGGTINKAILVGNLGTDPEVRQLEYNKIVKFPLATTESYTNRENQRVEKTEWHNIVVTRKGLADVCERYLRKGMKVYIEGRIQTRSWQDDKGQTRYMTEIQCNEMTMLSGRSDSNAPSGQSSAAQESSSTQGHQGTRSTADPSDDLPF